MKRFLFAVRMPASRPLSSKCRCFRAFMRIEFGKFCAHSRAISASAAGTRMSFVQRFAQAAHVERPPAPMRHELLY